MHALQHSARARTLEAACFAAAATLFLVLSIRMALAVGLYLHDTVNGILEIFLLMT
jgi:hypothetical protein